MQESERRPKEQKIQADKEKSSEHTEHLRINPEKLFRAQTDSGKEVTTY